MGCKPRRNHVKDELKKRGLITNGYSLPYNPELTERAKKLRNHMTLAEEKLWNGFLKKNQYGFRPQKQIDNFIVDFYCTKLKLVIEIDGDIHDETDREAYDQKRTEIIESFGLKVIRFKNEEVLYDFDRVCKRINEFIL
jgi:very-short-patch-repair endonuclease